MALRRYFSFLIFGLLMLWPIVHICIIQSTRISSWRLFGWGMYATPNPDNQARIRVVILDNPNEVPIYAKLHETITKISLDPKEESHCINIFLASSAKHVQKLADNGLCRNRALAKDVDQFFHFASTKHLSSFVSEALSFAQQSDKMVITFFTRQRFNVFDNRAYVESDVYKITNGKTSFVGTLKYNGESA